MTETELQLKEIAETLKEIKFILKDLCWYLANKDKHTSPPQNPLTPFTPYTPTIQGGTGDRY